jgi:hypothetical protein
VWGVSGVLGAARTPWSRVGMNFKDFDADAFERLYFGQR